MEKALAKMRLPMNIVNELQDVAERLRDAGYQNQADLVDRLATKVDQIDFASYNYTMLDAFGRCIHEECTCNLCPHCGGRLED